MGEAKRRGTFEERRAAAKSSFSRRHRSTTGGRGHQPYGLGPHLDPYDFDARCAEAFPPEAEPSEPTPPNVVRIDCGREPARPSLSAIRARKRAA